MAGRGSVTAGHPVTGRGDRDGDVLVLQRLVRRRRADRRLRHLGRTTARVPRLQRANDRQLASWGSGWGRQVSRPRDPFPGWQLDPDPLRPPDPTVPEPRQRAWGCAGWVVAV